MNGISVYRDAHHDHPTPTSPQETVKRAPSAAAGARPALPIAPWHRLGEDLCWSRLSFRTGDPQQEEGEAMRQHQIVPARSALLATATILLALTAPPIPAAAAGLWVSSV